MYCSITRVSASISTEKFSFALVSNGIKRNGNKIKAIYFVMNGLDLNLPFHIGFPFNITLWVIEAVASRVFETEQYFMSDLDLWINDRKEKYTIDISNFKVKEYIKISKRKNVSNDDHWSGGPKIIKYYNPEDKCYKTIWIDYIFR